MRGPFHSSFGGSVVLLVLAWRTVVGGISAFTSNSSTMMLGFPEWIVYAFMVPPMVLTGLIAVTQTLYGDFPEQAK